MEDPTSGRRAAPVPRRPKPPFSLSRPIWTAPAAIFLFVFFVLPLVHNAWRSVTEEQAALEPLLYYGKLVQDPYYRGVLIQTLLLSGGVTVLCLVLSYPVALFLVRYAGRMQAVIVFCLIAPLLTSIIMRTLGIRLIMARRGALNALLDSLGLPTIRVDMLTGPFAVYLGMIHVLVPFMVLSIAPVVQRIGPQLEESASVLGAGKLRTFLHVTLPLSREGIIAGSILVFMLANGSFVTQLLLGGGSVVTMPVLIFQQFNVAQNTAFAGAMGNTLLLLSVACLMLQLVLLRRRTVAP